MAATRLPSSFILSLDHKALPFELVLKYTGLFSIFGPGIKAPENLGKDQTITSLDFVFI